MFHELKLSLLPILSLPALIFAECRLQNSIDAAAVTHETRAGLCKPQGENDRTFAMRLSEIVVPTFDSNYMWEGLVHNKGFIIYNNACVPRGVTPGAMTAGPPT
ncbi:hypothetical protein BJX65DRAFT_302567 [Aspergillus insuetus]